MDPKNGLGKIAEMEEEHCYLVSEDSHGLAALNPFKSGKDGPHPATDNEDVVISYGIKAHQDASDACPDAINVIVCRYPNLWTDTGRVIDVPEELWMQIQLKDGWEATGAKLNHKPYVVPANERAIMDIVFLVSK